MPVLSFPCVVTHVDGASCTLRRRTWITGHDLFTLALAATEQLAVAVSVDQCASIESIESDREYRARRAAAERTRLERACYEGIHEVHYPVAPARWTARDLDRLLALAYRLLPTREPQWRGARAILQEHFGTNDGRRTPTIHYCLHVARGDYAAHLRLPIFPTQALAEWLATRAGQSPLEQPVVKPNALSTTPDASAEG